MLYTSDHGENVKQRDHNMYEVTSEVVEIPFIFYANDNYKKNFSDKYNQIQKSKDKPFMTNDLYEVLADILDIDSNVNDVNKSVLSDNFKPQKRLIYEQIDYDKLIKGNNKLFKLNPNLTK